ncbi:hypothetical protein MBELCI_2263 [Limimaricola cinnabarinus LL-001]|uniref:Uncharacterized protein n=1 Tax=Limimaricola cinnabarinus LL-001 TaxID=1337093 RepID=U2YM39_9RHOB|nr:hypothetical protein MBELCI_2263 [Limimaricola cinnabarinus LL-001]
MLVCRQGSARTCGRRRADGDLASRPGGARRRAGPMGQTAAGRRHSGS